MLIQNLGQLGYRDAWAAQLAAHEQVQADGEATILFVEHPPVITFGRRDGGEKFLLASEDRLRQLGVELIKSDRGGDITFHGPGQLVAYPILRLNDFRLSVGAFVHRLEDAVIDLLGEFDIPAHKDPAAVGVWVNHSGQNKKICAIGVRVTRGVTLHGLALNVTTDLSYFDLIVPCGLAGRGVTSLRELLGENTPDFAEIRGKLGRRLIDRLTSP